MATTPTSLVEAVNDLVKFVSELRDWMNVEILWRDHKRSCQMIFHFYSPENSFVVSFLAEPQWNLDFSPARIIVFVKNAEESLQKSDPQIYDLASHSRQKEDEVPA